MTLLLVMDAVALHGTISKVDDAGRAFRTSCRLHDHLARGASCLAFELVLTTIQDFSLIGAPAVRVSGPLHHAGDEVLLHRDFT